MTGRHSSEPVCWDGCLGDVSNSPSIRAHGDTRERFYPTISTDPLATAFASTTTPIAKIQSVTNPGFRPVSTAAYAIAHFADRDDSSNICIALAVLPNLSILQTGSMTVNTIPAERVTFSNGVRMIKDEVKPVLKRGDLGPTGWRCRANQLKPRMELVIPGHPVCIDCEGFILDDKVSVEKKGLGRVTATISVGPKKHKKTIIDTFVAYTEDVNHHLPPQYLKLGVKYPDILPENGARPLNEVLAEIQIIVDTSGIVVGHAFENEIHMLRGVSFDKVQIYDTQLLPEYRLYAKDSDPSLSDLAFAFFKKDIQGKGHSSVIDTRYNLMLFEIRQEAIEQQQKYRPPAPAPAPVDIETSDGSSESHHRDSSSSETASTSATSQAVTAARVRTITKTTTTKSTSMLDARFRAFANSRFAPAPGHLVALPNIPEIAKGRLFDHRTSTYA